MSERKFTPPTSFPAEYVTACKKKAIVHTAAGEGARPLVGQVYLGEEWFAASWTADGAGSLEGFDLCDPEPTVERQVWQSVYPDGRIARWNSQEFATSGTQDSHIGILRLDLMSDGTVRTEMEEV